MSPRPPPAAIDATRAQDEEILLRLPRDDPRCLFRASLVCRAWRSLLTSSSFGGRYRKLHKTPPLLGFFHNDDNVRVWFEPSFPTFPFLSMHPDLRKLFVFDCRHGLVLLRNPINDEREPPESLIVWDPLGRRQWEFPSPGFAAKILYDNAVVLCAADRCDHLDCHGGRFLVAYVGGDYAVAHASVFSSETRAWSPVASCEPPVRNNLEIAGFQPKALVGNVIYFNCILGSVILRFDFINLQLSVIHGPYINIQDPPTSVLMKTEQGVLGCATKCESKIRLWSMDTAPNGSVTWTQFKVIEYGKSLYRTDVIGFADGIGVFYLRTDSGILTLDLKSCRVKNMLPIICYDAIPYMSFYTPDQVKAITLPSTTASSSAAQDDEGDGWEEVGNGENEGVQQEEEEEAAQELFSKGSKAFEDEDFVSAVDFLRRSLKVRVVHHGKLSPKCRDTYYRYGWALLRKAQAWRKSNEDLMNGPACEYHSGLDMAWKMLHVARAILEKSPGSTREKVKILAALSKVSMQRGDIDRSFKACIKALDILAYLVDQPHHHYIINLQICFAFEFPGIGDANAISLSRWRIQNLNRVNVAFLADKGDAASATEVGLAKDIQFVTNILSTLEKKLEDLEQAITAEDSSYAESDRSYSTDGQSRSMSQDGSVSE